MNRKEFISTLGKGAAFALTVSCFGACNDEELQAATNVDFTLNLDDTENNNLNSNGGYLIKDKIVVAKTTNGDYVAATQLCSHDSLYEVVLQNDEWFCTAHSARFSLTGGGLNDKGSKGLTIYNTELTNRSLRVFS